MNKERIFSIYANTMGFGFVVLSDRGEILDYGVVSVRPVCNDVCLKRIKEIISYFQPEILIVEDYERSRKSVRVKNLIKKICEYKQEGLKIFKYSRAQIRNTFDVFGARNKYEISKKISEIYPQLINKLPEKRRTWEPENYYQGIFDALSLIFTHNYLTN